MVYSAVSHRRAAILDSLTQRIAALEEGFAGKEPAGHLIPTGWDEIDQRLEGGLVSSAVHEWFSCDGAAHRRSRAADSHSVPPPFSILIHLAWQALEHDPHRIVLWIGRACRPYFRALVRNAGREGEDRCLLQQSIFIDDPPLDVQMRLWAIDLAARSSAVACIVADGSALDMRASRRLQLAAQAGNALVLLTRPARELKQLSATATRWIVFPSLIERGLGGGSARGWIEARTPTSPRRVAFGDPTLPLREGEGVCAAWAPRLPEISSSSLHPFTSSLLLSSPTPRWTVHLLRCKGLQPVVRAHELPCEFALEVCRETGSLRVSSHVVDRSGPAALEEEHSARSRRIA